MTGNNKKSVDVFSAVLAQVAAIGCDVEIF